MAFLDPLLGPAVQRSSVGEVGAPAQRHLARVGSDQRNRPVNPRHTVLVVDGFARTVDQVEHLLSVGKAHHQQMVTPDHLVGEPDASLALPAVADDRVIYIQIRLGQEALGSLLPDPFAGAVEAPLQREDRLRREPAGEVAGRRGVRQPLNPPNR